MESQLDSGFTGMHVVTCCILRVATCILCSQILLKPFKEVIIMCENSAGNDDRVADYVLVKWLTRVYQAAPGP